MDGRRAEIMSDRQGVQYMIVPAGSHLLQITFEDTPARTAGAVISALALAVALGFLLVHYRTTKMEVNP